MLKLIPIIIIPFSFFLIFLGVKNLTDKFESFSDSQQNENSAQNSFTNEKIINNSHVNSSNDLASDNNPTKNKIHLNDNSYSNIEIKEEIKSHKDKDIIKKTTPKSLNTKDTINSSLKNDSTVKNSLQFGAFSKKKNADNLKNKIEKKVQKKFPSFSLDINYSEKTKLYKLLYFTSDYSSAKNICEFCKDNKINCLIKTP